MTPLLAESPGDLVLQVLDGGQSGFDAGFAPSGSARSAWRAGHEGRVVVPRSPATRAHRQAPPWPAGSWFAPPASSESREPAGSICANPAEYEDFWGNPAPTTPSTMQKPSRL